MSPLENADVEVNLTTSVGVVEQAARQAAAAGLCVVPPAQDGTKRPLPSACGRWERFKTTRPDESELCSWYPGRTGLGVVIGPVSERTECWDFDDRPVYEAFVATARECGLGAVLDRIEHGYCDDTPGGGVRWLVQYPPEVERGAGGRVVLARRPKRPEERQNERDTTKILIELPSYAILAPSSGRVHPSGKPYVRRTGAFSSIAKYTVVERNSLIELAHAFDARPRNEAPRKTRAQGCDTRPGDAFNVATT